MFTHTIEHYISLKSIIGHDIATKISGMGAVQFQHGYDTNLLQRIKEKALELKSERAVNKHLDFTFIPGADRFISEIRQLIHDKSRLERLSELAGCELEPYPHDVVSSTVSFQASAATDKTIDWHCDGVPITELIPLEIDASTMGGELEIASGDYEINKLWLEEGNDIDPGNIYRIQHRDGYSVFGQMMRVYHRVNPITAGYRITLVINLRSREKRHIDSNPIYYLAADNAGNDNSWVDSIVDDALHCQLPDYKKSQAQIAERRRMKQNGELMGQI